MRQFALKLSLSTLSLLLLAGVGEGVLRWFNPVSLDWRMVVGHPVRIETLAADFDGYFRETRVRTNEFGHRVPITRAKPYSRVKPPGAKRVLIFGDSFAFGDEWPAEDSFPEQLQQRLDPTLTRIQVLNFGVPGYNPLQEANYIRESALGWSPDVVVVQFAESNDLYALPVPMGGGTARAWLVDGVKRWLRRHVYLYSALTDLWYHGRDSRVGQAIWRVIRGPEREATSASRPAADFSTALRERARGYYRERQDVIERNELGWRQAHDSYRDIAAFLAPHRIPLVIVVVVNNWELECKPWRCVGVTTPLAVPLAEGREFHTLLKRHLGAVTPHYLPLDQVLGSYSLETLFEGKGHYGPKKNAIVAESLEVIMRGLDIVPKGFDRPAAGPDNP